MLLRFPACTEEQRHAITEEAQITTTRTFLGVAVLAAGVSLTPATATASTVPLPAQVLNLTDWHLTLPIGPTHDATQIDQPELATFTDQYFQTDGAGDGVVFTAPVGGSTTGGSAYPRSELRETTATGAEASWSDKGSAVNTMTVVGAATALPPVKPQVVVAQIHNSSSDVIEVVADGEKPSAPGTVRLGVKLAGKEQSTFLDSAYVLGTTYTLAISAHDGTITVAYNGSEKLTFKKSGSGWYFKAGAYTQSNPSTGDSPTAVGAAVIYSISVTH